MLRRLKIAARLSVSFGVLLLLLLAGFGVGLLALRQLHRHTERIVSAHWQTATTVAALKEFPEDNAFALFDLFRVTDPDEMEKILARVEANRAASAAHLQKLAPLLATADERAWFDRVKASLPPFDASIARATEYFLQGRRAEGVEWLSSDSLIKLAPFQAELEKLLAHAGAQMGAAGAAAAASHRQTVWILFGLGAGASALGVLLAWLVTRSIVRPLRRAETVVTTVAQGDLTATLADTSHDEIGQIARVPGRPARASPWSRAR